VVALGEVRRERLLDWVPVAGLSMPVAGLSMLALVLDVARRLQGEVFAPR